MRAKAVTGGKILKALPSSSANVATTTNSDSDHDDSSSKEEAIYTFRIRRWRRQDRY
jgi:hypothetical protein